jgi:hypothetical protein
MGEIKNTYKIPVRSLEGKILLKYKDMDKKIILRWILMWSLFWAVM